MGYPIVALLIKQGRLPYDSELAEVLKGLKWRELNERYRNYRKVEEEVKKIVGEKGVQPSKVDEYISKAREALAKFRLRKTTQLTL